MSLLHPHHLWWLLALPVLFWLALPPRPRQIMWTAHLAQWRLAHAALKRRPPRLSGPRFVLLALACIAAVVAHAGPVWTGSGGPRRLVVLLDASSSTGALQASGTSAFAGARELLLARFASLPPHVEVTLLRCGGPRLRRHGESARCLQDVGGPAGSLDVDLAAVAAGAANADTAVWTLTDGQGQAALPTTGALTVLRAAGPNAAVLAVRTVDRWPLPALTLEATVVCFADAACPATIHVAGAVAAVPTQSATLQPGQTATFTFELERAAAGGPLQLAVAVEGDVLPDDDAWRATLPPLPAPRIAVLADEEAGPFASAAAQALAVEVGGEVVQADPAAEVGLLLVDGGVAPVEPGRVRALCFGSRTDAEAKLTPWLEPRLADWDRTGALTAGLDFAELRVQAAFPETLPPGEAFLWGDDGDGERRPLAVVAAGERTASVHFAFRLQDSNLWLLPAFPQLLRRAFVRTYGSGALLEVTSPAPPPGEQDLRGPGAAGPDRPLPAFAAADRSLAALCVLLGLAALALRAFVR